MSSMRESDRPDAQARATPDRPDAQRSATPAVPARSAAPSPVNALALQRAVGNRAATRVLARWSKHPDEKEKGKLLSDEASAAYLHFNIPLNK
jgi:hypothetical protein